MEFWGSCGEAVSKNPEMLKTAMDTLSSMPEEAQSQSAQSAQCPVSLSVLV